MTTPEPVSGPATVEAVAGWLSVPADGPDRAHIETVVPAVNAYVRRFAAPDPAGQWPADIVQGAVLLAARNVRRRNSPAGVETVGDMGAVYVARFDRDLDQLLRLGEFRRMVVG